MSSAGEAGSRCPFTTQVPTNPLSLCDSKVPLPSLPTAPRALSQTLSPPAPPRAPGAPCGRSAGAQPRGAPTPAPPPSSGAPPPQPHPGRKSPAPRTAPPLSCRPRPAPAQCRHRRFPARVRGWAGARCVGSGSAGHPQPSRDSSVRASGPVGNGPPGGEGVFRSLGWGPASRRPSVPV